MKIVIPGGSGQVGTVLARAFHKSGHEVVVLSRTPASKQWRTVEWDGETLGDWIAEFEGADAIINLAGQSVNCRYHDHNRRKSSVTRLPRHGSRRASGYRQAPPRFTPIDWTPRTMKPPG